MKDLEVILCAIELERRRANRRYWTLFFAIMMTALCFAFDVDRSDFRRRRKFRGLATVFDRVNR